MDHAIAVARPKGMTPQRTTGLVFAGLLQVALIWALVEGLNIKVWPQTDIRTSVEIIREKIKPLPPPPVLPNFSHPTVETPVKPTFEVEDEGQTNTRITPVVGPVTPAFDRMAIAIGDTHTTPPYPPLALRLGEEGNVRLHLIISPQGFVTDAEVIGSSGYDDLDLAARNWIMAHWRYRPAMRGGAAAGSESDVLVRFDLKNAR